MQETFLLPGVYAIRTSLKEAPSNAEGVLHYKHLFAIESAFQSLKIVSLTVRPIHHRNRDLVRAHAHQLVLTHYGESCLRKNWHRFCLVMAIRKDKQVQRTSVVKPVSRTDQTKKKVHRKRNKDGEKVMSIASLLNEFFGRSRIIAIPKIAINSAHGIMLLGRLNVTQKSTFELLKIKV